MSFSNIFRIWSAFRNGIHHSRHKKKHYEAFVELASDDSFPASDPPAWVRTTSQNTQG